MQVPTHIAALLALLAVSTGPSGQKPRDPLAALDDGRPRDPWVFRSVLDGKPRMITAALADEMWVAYDTQLCGLYKCWRGGVKFDGAVYTTVHGPAPTSLGASYIEGIAEDVWAAQVKDQDVPVLVSWKGFRFNGRHLVMHYSVLLSDGRNFEVQEAPEYVWPEDLYPEGPQREELGLETHQPGLLRSFYTPDIPEDVKVTVKIRTDGVKAKIAQFLEREGEEEVLDAGGQRTKRQVARVVLAQSLPGNNVILFFAPLPPAGGPPPEPPKDEKKQGGGK